MGRDLRTVFPARRPSHPGFPDSGSAVKRGLTAKRPKRVVENDEYAAFVRRILAGLSRRVAAGDIEGLRDLLALADQIDTELQRAVSGLRGHGYSWAEIGARAGMTRQAAHQRWRPDTTDEPEVT